MITKQMSIGEVLRIDRNTAPIFMQYGMHCLGCPHATAESIEQAGMVHGVDVEGQRLGIERPLVELLGAASPAPVTYAGGARSIEDLELVREVGRGRVDLTIGSALDIFGGELPYADVVAWQRGQEDGA